MKGNGDNINKIETKTLVKLAMTVFIVFLCITYWAKASDILGKILTAAMPLLCGCIIAYPLNILMGFYERHFFPRSEKKLVLKSRTPLCLLFAILTLLAIIAFVMALIVPQLVSCVKLLAAEVPGAVEFLIGKLKELDIVPSDFINQLSSIDWESKIQQIAKTLFSGVSNVMEFVVSAVTSVVSGVASTVVAIIFACYLLAGKHRLGPQCKRVCKRYIKEDKYEKISDVLSVFNDSFHRFIVGQCTEAVILGTLCTVGMLILGLPYAPMIGAVIAFTALIPIVGAFLGGAVGAFLILMESPMQAVIFLVFLIILQQIEGNFIYPRVVGSSIGLPAIWVLAAVTIGGGVFGIFGMLIGVPLASAAYRLLREHVNKDKKPAPEALKAAAPEKAKE